MVKTKIAVLISGNGTNLQALIDAQKSGILKHGSIELVVSSSADAYGLKRAEAAGIATAVVTRKQTGSQRAFEEGNTTKRLQDYVKTRLLPYKYPREVLFIDELPKTGTGKIDRQALLRM